MSDNTYTPKRVGEFCSVLASGESVGAAAAAISVSRPTVYNWRKAHPDFRAAWDAAIERGTDLLEDEAKRRAWAGVEEPVFYKGEECGTVRKFSDTLLIFLLKARREKFRETQVIFNVDYSKLNNEQLNRLASGEHPRVVLTGSENHITENDTDLASERVQ